ncbi:MAG: response regulator, partial [Elusimicrobia bacterium]|nr:response regulator [Elusimicrobiota bacterium]
MDALIFDDDPFYGNLLLEIFDRQGLKAKYFPDGENALEEIRRERPGVILVDLMMPGLDGISICKQVKGDPPLAATKVVVVSGKSFPDDKARATWAQADLFVEKPFNISDMTAQISKLLRGRKIVLGEERQAAAPSHVWKARIWKEPGEPGCVSVIHKDHLIVFDAGQGLAHLAQDEDVWRDSREVWLFLSHFHKDHIAGLQHARRFLEAGRKMHIGGPSDGELPLQQLILRSFSDSISPEALQQQVKLYHLGEGQYQMGPDLRLNIIYTMHPGPCLAFRMEGSGRRLVFAPDSELDPNWEERLTDYGEKLVSLSKGADLLIHDARYSDEDSPRVATQGHSGPSAPFRVAVRAGVRRLLLH